MKQLKAALEKGTFSSVDRTTSSIVGAGINTRRFCAGPALLPSVFFF